MNGAACDTVAARARPLLAHSTNGMSWKVREVPKPGHGSLSVRSAASLAQLQPGRLTRPGNKIGSSRGHANAGAHANRAEPVRFARAFAWCPATALRRLKAPAYPEAPNG